ncbi:MAG: hypothetical protein FRX49_04115 [Trebouxia sp. A1-2]|nr:MAG: hypothetical protein FRX49_04115 [Trebouxia sp. A1-2]
MHRQVQQPLASWSELPHGMRQPKLGARGIGQRLDGSVGFAVGLQQIHQYLPCQAEMKHLAGREVASYISTSQLPGIFYIFFVPRGLPSFV